MTFLFGFCFFAEKASASVDKSENRFRKLVFICVIIYIKAVCPLGSGKPRELALRIAPRGSLQLRGTFVEGFLAAYPRQKLLIAYGAGGCGVRRKTAALPEPPCFLGKSRFEHFVDAAVYPLVEYLAVAHTERDYQRVIWVCRRLCLGIAFGFCHAAFAYFYRADDALYVVFMYT